MNFRNLHSFNVTAEKAYKIQLRLQEKLLIGKKYFKKLKYIASCDVAYSKIGNLGYAVVIVYKLLDTIKNIQDFILYSKSLNKLNLQQVEQSYSICKITFPYIPGYLAFREGSCILKAFRKIKIQPDLVIFDGHGIAHPRHMGLASHLGIILNVSTIGCAKNSLNLSYKMPLNKTGAYSPAFQNKEKVAFVLRSKKFVKPIFISAGFKIDLDISYKIIMGLLCKYRIPSILRDAHINAHKLRKRYENNK